MLKSKIPVISQVLYQNGDPKCRGVVYYPVFDAFDGATVVGATSSEFNWGESFGDALLSSAKAFVGVLERSQGQQFRVNGLSVSFMGEGDLHDTQFDEMEEASGFDEFLQIVQAESVLHTARHS